MLKLTKEQYYELGLSPAHLIFDIHGEVSNSVNECLRKVSVEQNFSYCIEHWEHVDTSHDSRFVVFNYHIKLYEVSIGDQSIDTMSLTLPIIKATNKVDRIKV